MNYSNYRISLDVHDIRSRVRLNVKRGDTKRKLFIHLSDGGVPYHIDDDCYAVFTATKSDGKKLYNECVIEDCTIEGCAIVYAFTGQTTNVSGLAECEIRLYDANNNLLTSPTFSMVVDNTVYGDGDIPDSSDEFTALTEMVSRGIELIGDYENALAQLEAIRNNAGSAASSASDSANAAAQSATNAAKSEAAAAQSAAEAASSKTAAEAARKAAEAVAATTYSTYYGAFDVEYPAPVGDGDEIVEVVYVAAKTSLSNGGSGVKVGDLIITRNGVLCAVTSVDSNSVTYDPNAKISATKDEIVAEVMSNFTNVSEVGA